MFNLKIKTLEKKFNRITIRHYLLFLNPTYEISAQK